MVPAVADRLGRLGSTQVVSVLYDRSPGRPRWALAGSTGGRPMSSSASSRAMPNPASRDRRPRPMDVADDAGTWRAVLILSFLLRFVLRFVYPLAVACLFKLPASEGSHITPIVHQQSIDIMYYSQEHRLVKYNSVFIKVNFVNPEVGVGIHQAEHIFAASYER